MKDAQTILLIDDDPDILWATERILAGAGYGVVTGSLAAEVIDLARTHRPALVLLDVILTDGDGLEVARQLKADPDLKDIFVVLMSGLRTSSGDQAKGLSEGLADGYLARPISKVELLARIDAFLRIRSAQEALRESGERFRAVTQTANDAIVSADSAGRIVGWNRAAEKIFGYSESEINGQPLALLIPARYHEGHRAGMVRVQAGGERHVIGHTVEMEGRRKDGGEFPLEFSLAEWEVLAGHYYTAIIRDITERKLAEETLRLAELEREKAKGNELLAQLIQGMAHEIRNPLFAINLNATALAKKASTVPDVAQYASFVTEHVGRLDSLMQDLLALGRQPAANETVECQIHDVVQAAMLDVQSQVPEACERVFVEAPECPISVQAVPGLLRLVMVHLIQNALQNSPPGGKARISVTRSGNQGEVKVSDEGPGLPEKIRERLFEPFVTTHMGRRGMGLALAKHYMTAMGGTLEAANNDPPPGATFTVRLPVGE